MNKIAKISIFHGIIKVFMNALIFFFALHFQKLGFTGAQIGTLFAVSTITALVTILPSGFSNDKFKSKNLISLGLLLLSIQYIGFTFTDNFTLTLILFVIGGVGMALYNTSMDGLFYKATENKDTEKKIGIFHTAGYTAIGIGIISAGILLQKQVDFTQIFPIIGIILIIMSIMAVIYLPNNSKTEFKLINYKKDILDKKVLLFLLIIFLFSIHFGAEATSYSPFLKENLGLNNLQAGLYMGLAIITMGITSITISKNLKKWKTQNVMILGLFLSSTGHVLMTVFSDPIISFLFRVYHETGDAAFFFFIYHGATKLFKLDRIGGHAGMISLTLSLGSALGAIIFGPVGEKLGYNISIAASGAIVLIPLAIAIYLIKEFKHEEYETKTS